MVKAVEDFCEGLPNGKLDYERELRELVLRLYAKHTTNGCKYFLDKTPRYHLIIEEVIRLFPEAKFIFLWRNPLAIIASLVETFGRGKWKLWHHRVDLFKGIVNLVSAYSAHSDLACAVRYEDILTNSDAECKRLFAYLGLPFHSEVTSSFDGVQLAGRLGDPVGAKQYRRISPEPLTKWEQVVANPVRKAWCRRYLYWVGAQRLRVMGYDIDQLFAQLNSAPMSFRFLASDLLYLTYSAAQVAMCRAQEDLLFYT